jgi:hypothetical protein
VDERKQVEPRAEGVLRSRLGSTVKQLASAFPPTGGKLGDWDDSDEDSEGWGWPLIENSRPCHLPSGYDDDDGASSGASYTKQLRNGDDDDDDDSATFRGGKGSKFKKKGERMSI